MPRRQKNPWAHCRPADYPDLGHNNFVSTKVLLQDFTPVTVLFTRFVIGYAFLWCLKPRWMPFSGWKRNSCLPGPV